MKKYFILTVVFLASVSFAYMSGRNRVLIDEFKVYQANLKTINSKEVVQSVETLNEFVKARYYYFGNRIPKDSLPVPNLDYGPVGTNALSGLVIGKGPTSASEEYHIFQLYIVSQQ